MFKEITIGLLGMLSILSICYGIMILGAGSGTFFFLVWFGLAIVFASIGAGIHFDLSKRFPLPLKIIILFAFLSVLLSFIVTSNRIICRSSEAEKENLDYIIVLGAQVKENGPSVVLKYRLDKAIEYLNNNPDTLCIVSGGKGSNEPYSEAEGMARYLLDHHVDKERIILEDQSRTTEQNLANSMKYITTGASVGLITNDFHIYRALLIAQDQDIPHIYGIAADSTKIYLPNNILREYLALLKHHILNALQH